MANSIVLIFVESRYKINRKKIREIINKVLDTEGVKSLMEISVAIVGDRKMHQLNKQYRGIDKTTNVLSFSLTEGESPFPHKNPSTQADVITLGDIVLSYPVVIKEAARDEMLVDEKVNQLVEHGLNHLLGIHHEE